MPGKKIYFVLSLFIVALLASILTYFSVQFLPKSPSLTNVQVAPSATVPTVKNDADLAWATTDIMGAYSFAYPYGWHVASLWPTNRESGITVAIDPEPINTAPRGGFLSAIMILDKSGLTNPDEIFAKDREDFKKSLQDLQEKTLSADFGTIYYYKGKREFFGEMMPTERYYFTLQGSLPDAVNKHVISVSLEANLPLSDVLRKIVASFQKPSTLSNSEKELLSLADKIVAALKEKDMLGFSTYAHPDKGVRFTPYANINPDSNLVFSASKLPSLFDDTNVYTWGVYDGSGLPIKLKFSDYYQKFIYDKDYSNASEKAVNRLLHQGNSLSNIASVYPSGQFVEYYIPGTPDSGEMDWGSLRLVFEKKVSKWYLVGVVHNQWTI